MFSTDNRFEISVTILAVVTKCALVLPTEGQEKSITDSGPGYTMLVSNENGTNLYRFQIIKFSNSFPFMLFTKKIGEAKR